MQQWFADNLHYVQMVTATGMILFLVALVGLGWLLSALVRNRAILATRAVVVIKAVAYVFGLMTGTVAALILLFILWPDASSWIVNVFIPKTTVWQVDFQQWLVSKIAEPRITTGLGLLMSKVHFGSMILGAVLASMAAGVFRLLMQLRLHDEAVLREKIAILMKDTRREAESVVAEIGDAASAARRRFPSPAKKA